MCTSFVLSLALIKFGGWEAREVSVNWLAIGAFNVNFGLKLDALSLMMLLVVTGVGSVIHVFSYGYMRDDPGFSRFFACMSLFTFSMLGIVSPPIPAIDHRLGTVGLSSYLLIGFCLKTQRGRAAKKAFNTNRLGDYGSNWNPDDLYLASSLNISESAIPDRLERTALVSHRRGLLIFLRCGRKSAQFPQHVWFPDAMEGPTPVSALIHAATMVAAGGYMHCRVFFISLRTRSRSSRDRRFTALLAAVLPSSKRLKRILADSTLSQHGYMGMGGGVADRRRQCGPPLITPRNFSKPSCSRRRLGHHLFAPRQDIWKMGGCARKCR